MIKTITTSLLPLTMTFFALSSASFAAEIGSGHFNEETKSIELNVTYGGGCGDHEFSLIFGKCFETRVVSCDVQLIEATDDLLCQAVITTTISIPVPSEILNDKYYSGANLTISGDNASKPLVKLPR